MTFEGLEWCMGSDKEELDIMDVSMPLGSSGSLHWDTVVGWGVAKMAGKGMGVSVGRR